MDSAPLDALVRREEMAGLIARISRDGRDLLLVTLIMNGLDASEIAAVLGVSASHVYRIRERLARELAAHSAWLAEEQRRRTGRWPARHTAAGRRPTRRRAAHTQEVLHEKE